MNEQQTPQTEKAPVKNHWGRLAVFILAIAAFFVIRALLTPPIEYKKLDYDAVLRTPNVFRNEYAIVEGTLMQILPVSPTAASTGPRTSSEKRRASPSRDSSKANLQPLHWVPSILLAPHSAPKIPTRPATWLSFG
jgi:hypothetical protein